MYTNFSLIFFSIFTSVVVYSRTSKKNKRNTKKTKGVECFGPFSFDVCFVHLYTCTVVQPTKKKCVEHTHAHHLSQLFSIFTSVVVYSRTIKVYSRTKNTLGLNISFLP